MHGIQKVIATFSVCLAAANGMNVLRRFTRNRNRQQDENNDKQVHIVTNSSSNGGLAVNDWSYNEYLQRVGRKLMVGGEVYRYTNFGVTPLRVVMGLGQSFTHLNTSSSKPKRHFKKTCLRGLDKSILANIGSFLLKKPNTIDIGSSVVFASFGDHNKDGFFWTKKNYGFQMNTDPDEMKICFGDTGIVTYVDYNLSPAVYYVRLTCTRWLRPDTVMYPHATIHISEKNLDKGFVLQDIDHIPRDIFQNPIPVPQKFDSLRLHEAIRAGEFLNVKGLIKIGANVNYNCPGKEAPYNKLPAELGFMFENTNERGPQIVRALEAAGAKLPGC